MSITEHTLSQVFSLSQHSVAMITEYPDGTGGKVYGAPDSRRFRLVEPKAAGHLMECLAHVQNRTVEVDVDPLETILHDGDDAETLK